MGFEEMGDCRISNACDTELSLSKSGGINLRFAG
ncbi:hypothetical protein CCHOA_11725 [Corynebacterium choanae]|uniref:Uncharacterized protein n=1 Tax=Corynebacterium choanae TaxID=1862358 RepID=A0A3G6J9P5_9CORY|nr:hypothetical protein CCHOA_11725 [Corynebacterium choanae]